MARSASRHGATVGSCLSSIGVDSAALGACQGLDQEFGFIKKAYFKRVLACHPDKGGDPAVFRDVQGAFEVLRDLFDNGGIASFAPSSSQSKATASSYERKMADMADLPTPSWEFYAEAAEEPVPSYRVELAKSARSACNAKGAAKKCVSGAAAQSSKGDDPWSTEVVLAPPKNLIGKGEVRVGWIDREAGHYGRWVHLCCWRVPSKVWLGLPDPDGCPDPAHFEAAVLSMNEVLLCGLRELPPDKKQEFLAHIMDKGNWARLVKRKPKKEAASGSAVATAAPGAGARGAAASAGEASVVAMSSRAGAGGQGGAAGGHQLVTTGPRAPKPREAFEMPVPGRGSAVPGVLNGKTVVMTGIFPEVGGGAGLNLGKDKVKGMVQSFGGKVTGSVSGRTDILLVGKEPGLSKVSQARGSGKCQLLSLIDIKEVLEGAISLEGLRGKPKLVIGSFSAGYRGNGLANYASGSAVDWAAGLTPEELKPEAPQKAAAAPSGPKQAAKRGRKPKAGPPPAAAAAAPVNKKARRGVKQEIVEVKAEEDVGAPSEPKVAAKRGRKPKAGPSPAAAAPPPREMAKRGVKQEIVEVKAEEDAGAPSSGPRKAVKRGRKPKAEPPAAAAAPPPSKKAKTKAEGTVGAPKAKPGAKRGRKPKGEPPAAGATAADGAPPARKKAKRGGGGRKPKGKAAAAAGGGGGSKAPRATRSSR